MIDRLEEGIEEIKNEMSNKENPVTEEKTKPAPKKAAPKKKTAPAKKAAAAPAKKTKDKDENLVTLKGLSAQLKLDPRDARKKLRKAGLKAEGRWAWPAGSSELKKIEAALKAE